MASLTDVFVPVRPDTRRFGPELRTRLGGVNAGAGGARVGRSFSSGFLGSVVRMLKVVGTLYLGTKIVGFFKGAVSEASNLEESINAVNVTFGKAAGGILKLGKQAANSVGLSRVEFNALAVQFGAFATKIAGSGGNITGVIEKITTRAADFASVMNLDVAEAARLFQSGLAGETEPLRRFGIDLSAAAVEAHAYKVGIAEAGEELTENQKIQARYSLLMKQTSKVQGDFANTSGSLANQQRILGARWDNMKARLGQFLIPLVTKAVTTFNNWIPTLTRLGRRFGEWLVPRLREFGGFIREDVVPILADLGRFIVEVIVPALVRMAKFIGRNKDFFIPFTAALVTGVAVFKTVIAVTRAWAAAQAILNIALTANPIGIVIVAIAALVAGLVVAWRRSETFRAIVTGAFNAVRAVVVAVWNWIRNNWNLVYGFLRRPIGLARDFIRAAWNRIGEIIRAVFNWVRENWPLIRAIFINPIIRVRDFIRGAWRRIGDFIRAVFNWVREHWPLIRAIFINPIARARDFIRAAWNRVGDFIRAVWNWIRRNWNRVYAFFRNPIVRARDAIVSIWNRVQDRIQDGINAIRRTWNRIWAAAERRFRSIIAKVVDVFLAMVQKILEGAAKAFGWVPKVGGKLKDARDAFKKFRRDVNRELTGIKDERVNIGIVARSRGLPAGLVRGGAGNQFMPSGGRGPMPSGGAGMAMRRHTNVDPDAKGGDFDLTTSGLRPGRINRIATDYVIKSKKHIREAIRGAINNLFAGRAVGPGPGRGRFHFPLPRGRYTVGQGLGAGRGHTGVDFPAVTGTPVFSPFNGILRNVSVFGSYGRHANVYAGSWRFIAAHLSRFARGNGPVRAGSLIGFVGSTGNSTGPHLHAEFRRGGSVINPRSVLSYDRGGLLPPGFSVVHNGTGRNEVVVPPDKQLAPVFNIYGTSEEVIARIQARMAYSRAVHARP